MVPAFPDVRSLGFYDVGCTVFGVTLMFYSVFYLVSTAVSQNCYHGVNSIPDADNAYLNNA